jgi:hypothetical protein
MLCENPAMKTLEKSVGEAVPPVSVAKGGPLPFTPELSDVPAVLHDAPIEPAPTTTRRTIKGKLQCRGKSQPLPVVDPWA